MRVMEDGPMMRGVKIAHMEARTYILLGMKQWDYPCIGSRRGRWSSDRHPAIVQSLWVSTGVCLDIPSRRKRDGSRTWGVVQDGDVEWLMESGRWVRLQVRTHATTNPLSATAYSTGSLTAFETGK